MRMHDRSGIEQTVPVWPDLVPGPLPSDGKDPAAVALGRRGGLKGGRARAAKLTPDERVDIAKRAAAARWHGKGSVSPAPVIVPATGASDVATALRESLVGQTFGTILADPPWRFINRTGKVAPEHRRLARYETLTPREIASLPVRELVAEQSHCYLWTPNAMIVEALRVLEAWGFTYKAMLVWHKVRKDGGSDGRGVGFYFRNVTETVLFGVRGNLRTFAPGRRQVNLLATRKREHSRKPDELYAIVEGCSPGPYLELFARYPQPGWWAWGDEVAIEPRGRTYRGYGA